MRISRSIPIAATALLAVGLTACSGDDGSSGSSASSGTATQTTEAVSSDIGESTPLTDHNYVDGAGTITGVMGEKAAASIGDADVSIDLSDVSVSDGQICGTLTTKMVSLPKYMAGESEAAVDEYFSRTDNFRLTIGLVSPLLDVHRISGDQVATKYFSTLDTHGAGATYDPQARTVTEQLCAEVPDDDEVVLTLTTTGFESDQEGWLVKL